MASMRKLQRRLLRWDRYDRRYVRNAWLPIAYKVPPGFTRAARAVYFEEKKRKAVRQPVETTTAFQEAGLL